MSARMHSDRNELFSSRSGSNKQNSIIDGPSAEGKHQGDSNGEDLLDDAQDPLQLEHIIGFSGDYRNTVLSLPSSENLYVKSMGNLVTVENLLNPHDQKIMRGHDMPISALAVSRNGTYIASGQRGTKHYKGLAAPVFVWSGRSLRRHQILKGLSRGVQVVAFSTDEKYLAAADEDGLFYIWDLQTAEVIYGQKFAGCPSVLQWVLHQRGAYHTSYELVIGINGSLLQSVLAFEPDRVQWMLKSTPFMMPTGGGLVRFFNCADLSSDRVFVYVGTTGGEMMVFRRDTRVFRACIPICTNGVHSICALPDGVLCGGGDGTLRVVNGADMAWRMAQSITLEKASIIALSLSTNQTELIVGASNGTVYRCLTANLSYSVVSIGMRNAITVIAFGSNNSSSANDDADSKHNLFFATGTLTSEIKIWDISDYACVATVKFPKSGAVQSLCFVDSSKYILSGWEDGYIRCTDTASMTQTMWYLHNAHRDGVRALSAYVDQSIAYFVSGGGDGAVRVWRLGSRECVAQYSEHGKGVVRVAVDIKLPNIIHSVGADGTVLAFDLKTAKRRMCHMVTSGVMADFAQRRDSENELVTCDNQGRLLYWDIDVRDPVMAMQDPSRAPLRSCAMSPSGRFLAFAGDDAILKVLDVQSGKVLSLGQGHSDAVESVVWSPDERQLVTGGRDCCVCIWNFFLGGGF